MSVLTEIEASLLSMLRENPDLAAVQTFEDNVRESLFGGSKLTSNFRPNELPAIAVTAQLKPSGSTAMNQSEIAHNVPVTLVAVTKSRNKEEALNSALEIQQAVIAVLHHARRSGNELGFNTLVTGEVEATSVVIEENPFHFGIATTEATVLKIVEV